MNFKHVPETVAVSANGSGGHGDKGSELDSLLDRVMAQCRAGRSVDLEGLVDAHPELESELRQAVPALIALELSNTVTIDPHMFGAPREVLHGNRTLGDFKLLREVGRGGMGVVYEAEQISLGRRVALKVLPMAGLLDERQLQRFKNEARAAASLHHPNIVPVYSVGTEHAVHFYAMQLIDGQTLAEFIQQMAPAELAKQPLVNRSSALERLQGSLATLLGTRRSTGEDDQPLTVDVPKRDRAGDELAGDDRAGDDRAGDDRASAETVEVAEAITQGSLRSSGYFRLIAELGIQVAEALEYAHSLGIVHRDIKPSNLLLDGSGKVWVADFGLAYIEADAGMTMTGDLLGTLRYMSPEQTLGQRGLVDGRADIYSLGISLYELLTARPAFPTANRQQLLRQLVEQEPVPPRQLNPAIPKDLETIVLKAIAKDPQQRYAMAQELADDLRRLLNHQPVRAKRPTLVDQSRKWLRRHPSLVAASILVLLITSLALGLSTVLISAAYEQEGNERLRAEQAVEEEQRQRLTAEALRKAADDQRVLAEENFRDALAAVDQMLVRVSEERLIAIPQMQSVRKELMSDAAEFYNRFVERRPDDPQVRSDAAKAFFQLGNVLRELQDEPEAELYYRRARELITGKELADQPRTPEARQVLQNVLWQLGNIMRKQNRLEESLSFFVGSVQVARDQTDSHPDVAEYQADLAFALVMLGEFQLSSRPLDLKNAEKNAREALQLLPNSRSYRCLGRALLAQGRLDEAHSNLIHATTVGPHKAKDEAAALASLASLEFRRGNPTNAANYYQKAIDRFQDGLRNIPSDGYLLKSWRQAIDELFPILKQLERHDEVHGLSYSVIDLCTEILHSPLSESLPLNTVENLWNAQSTVYESHLSSDAAEQRARQDFAKYPSVSQRLILARTLLRKGETAEARSMLQSQTGELNDPNSLIQLAELEASEKNTDAAIVHYRRAMQLLEDRLRQQPTSHTSVSPWRNAVERFLKLLSLSGQEELRRTAIQESLAFCDEILAGPHGPSVAYDLWESQARILSSMTDAEMSATERLPQIIEAYEKMNAGNQERPHLHKQLAWCYFDLQKFDEALEHLQRAVELEPRDRRMLTWRGGDAISACPSDSFVAALVPLADRAVELSGEDVGVRVMKAQIFRAIALRCRNMNLPETETFARQAFELSTELARMTDYPDASAQRDALHNMNLSLDILLKVLRDQDRTEEFQRCRDVAIEVWRELIRLRPDDINAPLSIVGLLVADGRWAEAVEELNSVCEQTQTVMPRYWRGLAQLALQDQAAYRETCADLLERFSSAPDEGGFALWTCALAPAAVDDYGPLLQMARSLEEKAAANPMLETSIAAAYYRAGQNDEALLRLTEAAKSTDNDRSSPAYALYFLAMAQHGAGQLEEAGQHLDQANQLTEAILAEHQEHRSVPWNRRLTLQLLRSEAEILLASEVKEVVNPEPQP